jgi:hypothetical protein
MKAWSIAAYNNGLQPSDDHFHNFGDYDAEFNDQLLQSISNIDPQETDEVACETSA